MNCLVRILPCLRFTLLFACTFASSILTAATDTKPNIVLFYIDDWAWYGSPVAMDSAMANSKTPVLKMPNVERLANHGMRFKNAYGSQQCSPARVCVQTGQTTARSGFTVYLNSKGQDYYDHQSSKGFPVISCIADSQIDPKTTTIPEALKPLGYTSAHIGKWHMGGDPADEGYLAHDGNTNNNPGNTIPKAKNQRMPEDMKDPKLMFSITDRAIKFMETQAQENTPFFLQISHYAFHEGPECLPETRRKYVKHPVVQAYYKENGYKPETVKRKQDPANWLGMGNDLDGRIGAVLDRMKTLGIEENTYVIVVADNGYRQKFFPGKKPLHAHKWWAWQGGIRVPMIVKGPGIKANSVFTANVINYDFLPTFVAWAGGDPETLKDIDGQNLAPYLAGKKPEEDFLNRPLFFHYPHWRSAMPHSALIAGNKKIMHFYDKPDTPMLFDLATDPGEVSNIAQSQPETHKQMHKQLFAYLKGVNARMPKINPDFDQAVYQKDPNYAKRQAWGAFEGKRPLADDEK